MGQVNYKSDYATFSTTTPRSDVEGHDTETTGKCLRPRARISRALAGALLLSVVVHASISLAIALSPAAPAPMVAEYQSYSPSTRVVHLDWDAYGGDSAADIDASEAPKADLAENSAPQASAPKNPTPQNPTPPEAAAAVVHPEPNRERTPTRDDDVEPHVEERDDTADNVNTAPVDALVASASDAPTRMPNTRSAPSSNNTGEGTGASKGGGGGDSADGAGIARGPNRRAGSKGQGTTEDYGKLRRGHMSQLNRAIRKKNPCTRKLSHRGLSGDVVLGLTQHSNGNVDEVRVLRSSGEPLIDDAAKQFVRNQQGLPAPAESLTGDVWKIGLRFQCDS